jgi:hypothetical protein
MVPPSYYTGPWPEGWAREGYIADQFGVDPGDLRDWIAVQNEQTACWMLTLEIWGQLFIRGRTVADLNAEFLHAAPGGLRHA